jgi:tripartite-type tricarboxylate transporter receptor subunit TctC
MKRLAFVAVLTMAAVAAGGGAIAQQWPTKPVRLVVPWPAGGSADTTGRIIADYLEKALHESFVVENRPGASGMIGSAAVAHADPDGYTFLVSGMPSHIVAPAAAANPSFDPIKDFTHVAYVGGSPIVIVAHKSLGLTRIADLLALARSKPEGLGYVSAGVGSLGNLIAEVWAKTETIKLSHIPYKGGAQAAADLVAGHVKLGSMTFATAQSHIRAGTLVPLAVSASQRMVGYENVPTFKELGHPELTATTWWAISAPAGLPHDIVQKMNHEVEAALDTPSVQKRLDQQTVITEKMTPEEFTALVVKQVKDWGPVAKAALAGGK